MGSGRIRLIVGALVAAALTAGVIAIAIAIPSAGGSTTPGLIDAGVLHLHVDSPSNNYLRLDAPDGSGGYLPGTPAPITPQPNCLVTMPGDLLAITPASAPAGGVLGFKSPGFGVKTAAELPTGSGCSQVNGLSQTLSLSPLGTTAGKSFDLAELDLETSNAATIRAEMSLNGKVVGTRVLVTSGGNGSPPTATWHNNFRMRLPETGTLAFNKVSLSVDSSTPSGNFKLEGGANGTPAIPGGLGESLGTLDSVFHLVDIDGTLPCGGTANTTGSAGLTAGVTRLGNQGGGTCTPVAYALRTSTDTSGNNIVDLTKDVTNQGGQLPQFTMTIAWPNEPATNPITRQTQIDTGTGLHPLRWCNGTPTAPTLPPNEIWCLSKQVIVPAGLEQIQVTETLYGLGDPRVLR